MAERPDQRDEGPRRRSDPRTPRARRLRKEATPAERRLWPHLRNFDVLGSHFRRQAPVGAYVADFACHRHRVVVELDGSHHGYEVERRRDARRTRALELAGYVVLRFWNHEVFENLAAVLDTIESCLMGRGAFAGDTGDG